MVTAAAASPEHQEAIARALLDAVLHQPAFGPGNPLAPEAFAMMLEAAPEALASSLATAAPRHLYGGQRFLQRSVWGIPGRAGARWLLTLARSNDTAASFLYQDMRVGSVPMWSEEDWPDRIDALRELADEPRPQIVTMVPILSPPRRAGPSLVRLVMAHGVDERDWLVRSIASDLRGKRGPDPRDDVDLVDWTVRDGRRELFRWLVELMGDDGDRPALVAAAVRAGRVPAADARWLSEPIERPAWADGEVPWEVDDVVEAGDVVLPDGRLTGGDPWWTGGAEGLPWVLDLPAGRHRVLVVISHHPLGGRECAALHLVVDPASPVQGWTLVPSQRGTPDGYNVEVGVAGFGAVEVYDRGVIFESEEADFPGSSPGPSWATVDGGEAGSLVFCTVGPQHQMCRTWVGTAARGRVVAVVTDLGLLDLDLASEALPPWSPGGPAGA